MTLDLDAVRARHAAFEAAWDPEYMAPDGPAKAARSAEDIPALLVAIGHLQVKVARLNSELAEKPQPHRGDQVEVWLKRQRDGLPAHAGAWHALDLVLDLYRLHADCGVPLDQDVPGPHDE